MAGILMSYEEQMDFINRVEIQDIAKGISKSKNEILSKLLSSTSPSSTKNRMDIVIESLNVFKKHLNKNSDFKESADVIIETAKFLILIISPMPEEFDKITIYMTACLEEESILVPENLSEVILYNFKNIMSDEALLNCFYIVNKIWNEMV